MIQANALTLEDSMSAFLRKILFLAIFIFAFQDSSYAQASWEKFGQNRVQFREFSWRYYDSTHFRAFYYKPGKELAQYILSEAEQDLTNIVQLMGGRLPRKLNLILYNSYNEYIQSNIGRQNDGQLNQADGGVVEVVGDNIPIYFTGSHEDLKKQVRKGVAKVIKDNMLFGDNIKDVVKNAIKMNVPEWYTAGYVQYISEDWSPDNEAEMQSLLAIDSTSKFNALAQQKPELIGFSFWQFVSKKYGENYISNLLYLTRFRKSVDQAMEIVLKKKSKEVYQEWRDYYSVKEALANVDDIHFGKKLSTKVKSKFDANYSQFKLSPNASQVAFVERHEGLYKVIIQETSDGDQAVTLDGGIRSLKETNDPNYPTIAWSHNGKKLAILYLKNNHLFITLHNVRTQTKDKKFIKTRKIERITGMCFSANENTLIISGIKKGQSDIFRYTFRGNRLVPVTNDIYDDREPSYVSNGERQGILFVSNRNSAVLDDAAAQESHDFNNNFNIYFFDEKQGKKVIQVTKGPAKVSNPQQFGTDEISYIQEENGKLIRKIAKFEKDENNETYFSFKKSSTIPYSILDQNYQHSSFSLMEIIKRDGAVHVYNTDVKDLRKFDEEHANEVAPEPEAPPLPEEVYSEYLTEFEDSDTTSLLHNIFTGRIRTNTKKQNQEHRGGLLKRRYKRYTPTFYPDFIATSLDNSLLFTRYQPYSPSTAGFENPPLSGLLTLSLNDIMEDYQVTGGIRMPSDFNGITYFLEFGNFKKRLDWKFLYFHTARNQQFGPASAPDSLFTPYTFSGKLGSEYFQTTLTYPFNPVHSLHLNFGLRYDWTRYQATDKYSIEFPSKADYWSFMRFEYVYDNSINPIMNIWKGTRGKAFAEYQYKLNSPSKGFYNMGFDVRNYKGIYKNFILASRFAGAVSGGSTKLLYFLGGVDNPIIPNIEFNTRIDPEEDYAFQTTATNLRGYKQRSRAGSSYFVINEELRLPVYNTFFKRSIKSGFLRNLQLVAFTDIGTAWRGLLPDEDNIVTTRMIFQDPVNVIIRDSQRYLGMGYGAGIRTRLLGYFMRVDAAWNIDGGRKPMWHISLATDF